MVLTAQTVLEYIIPIIVALGPVILTLIAIANFRRMVVRACLLGWLKVVTVLEVFVETYFIGQSTVKATGVSGRTAAKPVLEAKPFHSTRQGIAIVHLLEGYRVD